MLVRLFGQRPHLHWERHPHVRGALGGEAHGGSGRLVFVVRIHLGETLARFPRKKILHRFDITNLNRIRCRRRRSTSLCSLSLALLCTGIKKSSPEEDKKDVAVAATGDNEEDDDEEAA